MNPDAKPLLQCPSPDEGRQPRPLVWIVDDSPLEAAMARRALTAAYEVEVFTDGSALIERFAVGFGPSALVLDWQMPGMSGIEVCRFLRSRYNETELPILMLTVYGHKTDLMDGLTAGANDYLTKPYNAAELVARVSSLTRLKRLFEAARSAEQQRADLLERERVARREAEAANTAKDEFLAMVSHELRTPLNAILGWTRMLRAGALSPEHKARALETVERNAMAQTQLIDDLFDMARIISGKLTIEIEPIKLVNLVNLSIDAIRPAAEAKGVRIEVKIGPDTVFPIVGDPNRLRQVVSNLLTNAIKFTPKGGRVVVELVEADGVAQIAVGDSGCGIDPAFLPYVFERFRQGDEGPKRTQGGLGLGLAIVRHIVDLHGGTVVAESEGIGKGSTFRLRLPFALSHSQGEQPGREGLSDIALLAASNQLSGLRILVVDDDPDALELLATVLRRCGAAVVCAHSAVAAFDQVQSVRPDVIVSDVGMPGQDGHELMRRVRALPDDCGGRTPSVALTAFARAVDRTLAVAAGFSTYLPKPVEPAALVRSVASLGGRLDGR
jgi:signal transduction histidine kinase